MSVSAADSTSLLTGSAQIQLGIAALRSAEQVQASVLQLFPPPSGMLPGQYGQVGATTSYRGNIVNMVV